MVRTRHAIPMLLGVLLSILLAGLLAQVQSDAGHRPRAPPRDAIQG